MKLVDTFSQIFSYTGYLLQTGDEDLPENATIQENFSALIETARNDAEKLGIDEQLFNDALFPVCAWVDEKILTANKPFSKKWIKYQLQRKYFHTTSAGELFFDRMNALDPEETDLRSVFAYCLSLGFCGKYFKEDDMHRINEINRANLRKLIQSDEIDYPDVLFPHAYGEKQVHKKWNNRPGALSILLCILPPAIFAALYFFYDSLLAKIFNNYTM